MAERSDLAKLGVCRAWAPGHLMHVGPAKSRGPADRIHVEAIGQNIRCTFAPLGTNQGLSENIAPTHLPTHTEVSSSPLGV